MFQYSIFSVFQYASVLTLDSKAYHHLYFTGWLEPLLDRIAENQTIVVAPNIDTISDATLQYFHVNAKSASIGGFNWNLVFNWHPIPEREWKRRARSVDPVW